MSRSLSLVLVTAAVVLAAVAPGRASAASVDFTDWTSVNANVATGTLHAMSVSLSGTHVWNSPVSELGGQSNFFADAAMFSPPLALSDHIQISGATSASYTLNFGASVTDPVVHLASVASTLHFPSVGRIVRVSGSSGFTVSGNTVTGDLSNAAGGTVRLVGTFSSVAFTATTLYDPPVEDGIALQVGAPAAPPPVPTPTPIPPVVHSRTVDIRVSGIEVTQGTQWSGCAGCEGTLPSRRRVKSLRGVIPPSTANYQGVRMVAGDFTVVRVFATFLQPADRATLSRVTAKLEILDAQGDVIRRLTPDTSPATLRRSACWTCVTLAQRADPDASFNFLVPWQATSRHSLSFRATVSPIRVSKALVSVSQCRTCHANVFTLSGVPFVRTLAVPVHPIPLTVGGMRTGRTENEVFGGSQTVLPPRLEVRRWEAPLAVDGMNNDQAVAAVARRASDDKLPNDEYPVGVFFSGEGRLANGITSGTLLAGRGPASLVQDTGRSLTSVTHELGHGLGLPHADTGSNCRPLPKPRPPIPSCTGPHPDGTDDCGGNSDGQVGRLWPPDNEGRLQSVGLDRRAWNVVRTGSLPSTFVEGFTHDGVATGDLTGGARYYDFMSYCPGGVIEALDWISVINWNALLDFHPPAEALSARPAGGRPVRVIATVDGSGGASIFDVAPGRETDAAPTAGTPFRIELRDAAGATVASVAATAAPIHDGSGSLLTATLPFAPSAAAAVVTRGGTVLARRARSSHAPVVRLLSPGRRVGGTRTTIVRWSARDADGDRLAATVDYSRDAGRTWKVVASGPASRPAQIPSRFLSASRDARLRVRVSDGFDVGTAISGRLRAVGAPPSVRITGAKRGGRVLATSTLLLEGTAFDDAARPLRGGRLKWYANGRLIGRGELLTVRRLPPGSTLIELRATDSHGRTAEATRRLEVLAPEPVLSFVRAPAAVSRHARRIRMALTSNVSAVFKIAGARHRIGRKRRTIAIAIHPGRSTLRLPYSLRSRGGVTRGTYVVLRRD